LESGGTTYSKICPRSKIHAITGDGQPEQVEGNPVTAGLFPLLDVEPVLGRKGFWTSGDAMERFLGVWTTASMTPQKDWRAACTLAQTSFFRLGLERR